VTIPLFLELVVRHNVPIVSSSRNTFAKLLLADLIVVRLALPAWALRMAVAIITSPFCASWVLGIGF
jgi:hypothetical protein